MSIVQNTPQENFNFKALSLDTLLKQSYTVEYLIDSILPKNESLLIVGKCGCGKSTLVMQIAVELCDPLQNLFLGLLPISPSPQPRKVLIIQAENHGGGLSKHFTEMLQGRSMASCQSILTGIYFMSNQLTGRASGDLMAPAFYAEVERLLAAGHYDVVILDPLASFHSGEEFNNEQMRRVLDRLQALTENYHATLIVVHHDGKNPANSTGGRGASSIGDWAANVWQIRNNKGKFELENLKARNSARYPSVIKLELKNSIFTASSATSNSLHADLAYVVNALKNLNGQANSTSDLVNETSRLLRNDGKASSPSIARPLIDKAVNSGLVTEIHPGGNKITFKLI